jgi:restriction system protein
MAIPDYETIMLPLLKLTGDKKEHQAREAVEKISDLFNLTEEDRKELLPSGTQRVISNRVGWATTYLKKCNILEAQKRGVFKITDRGINVLQSNVEKIDSEYLKQFPEFKEFKTLKPQKTKEEKAQIKNILTEETPEEILENAFAEINDSLAQELLLTVKNSSPSFFEGVVVELLVKMGYGGSLKDAGQAIGKAGDEGIDGIIKEDKLGLDAVYIQAKKWDAIVGRPEIQKFAGALQGQRARKGIFITTSKFSREAMEYVKNIESKIVLIDGERFTELMIENAVGVSTIAMYEIKKIDTDFFDK